MKRINKYLYLYVVQGDYGYGHGWEDLTAHKSYKAASDDMLSQIRWICSTTRLRIVRRRETNPKYKGE